MSLIGNESSFAVWETLCDLLSESNGKRTIFGPMPESYGRSYVFEGESPRFRINSSVDHHSFR
jgi:hypothetical protein